MKIIAPWSVEQVKALNEFQANPFHHPYTCPYAGDEVHHPEDCGECLLVATVDGWTCTCGYTQKWAWNYSAGGVQEQPM